MSATAGTTLAQRLLCLRLTSGVCVAGAVGAAICAATGGTAPAIIAISALMTQAAAYGINRLSARADQAHADLARQADELTRGLGNADVHRLMGRAVSLALRVQAQETDTKGGLRPVLTTLAAAVDAQWPSLDEGTLPEALRESNVSAYFDQAPEGIKAQPVLDADLWREVLEPLAREGGDTPSNDEWASIGAVLTARYPRALYAVAKTSAIDGDPAWPGLLLRLLAEQRGVMEFAAHEITHTRRQTEKNTEHLHDIKDALADIKVALAQLGDIGVTRIEALLRAMDKRDDARSRSLFALVKAEGQRMREGLSFVWTLAGRSEDHMMAALSKLDAIASLAGSLPEMDRTLREVAQGVAALQRGTLTVASMKARNNLAAARVIANRFFTGRADDLARVRAALTADGGSVVHALGGEGGIGKSELAKAYALIFAGEYDGVWWIDAAAHALPTALARVYELATGRPPPEKATPEQVAQLLADHWSKERPLIILDNVDDLEHFTLLGPLAHGHVLATTRDLVRTHAGVKVLRVDVLPVPDAVGLLRKEIGEHRDMPSDVDLAMIAEELGGHALAVALAGAFLASSPDISTAQTLAKIREGGRGEAEAREEGERGDPLGLKYRHSVAASLSLHFDRPEVIAALPLLASAAYLHPVGMPLDLLAAGAAWTVDQARKAARVLDRASIVRLGETVSVHRLTQAVARSREDVAGGVIGSSTLARLLDGLLELYRWPMERAEELLDHTNEAARLTAMPHALTVAKLSPVRESAVRLHAELARRFWKLGRLDPAAAFIQYAIAWGEVQMPRDERTLATWYCARARIRHLRGDLPGAEADIQKTIAWQESQSPLDKRTLAVWYASRASMKMDMGVLADALADARASVTWLETCVPRDERELAISHAVQANICQQCGYLAEAEGAIQRSIDWTESQPVRDERLQAVYYARRARIRHLRNKLADAESDVARSIRWEEACIAPNRLELAVRYATLSRIFAETERAHLAVDLINLSLAWARKQDPVSTWGIALWSADRATILLELGRVQEAIADITQCIAWHREHQPRARFRMAHFLRWQARILAAAAEWDKAAASIGEAIPLHESEFGAEHDWTARARRTLDAIVARQLPER